jgi:hypothetical protein
MSYTFKKPQAAFSDEDLRTESWGVGNASYQRRCDMVQGVFPMTKLRLPVGASNDSHGLALFIGERYQLLGLDCEYLSQ